MSRKDDLLAKAARRRERAAELEAEIRRRTGDPMAEHFPAGPGRGGRRRTSGRQVRRAAAADERTWQLMRERDRLLSAASSLEATARTVVFSDDHEGLAGRVAQLEKAVADCDALLADPAKVAKYGRPAIADLRSGYVRKLSVARRRLADAESLGLGPQAVKPSPRLGA